jgi:hypothetical protein
MLFFFSFRDDAACSAGWYTTALQLFKPPVRRAAEKGGIMPLIFHEYLITSCGGFAETDAAPVKRGSLKAPLPHVHDVLAHFSVNDVVALNT